MRTKAMAEAYLEQAKIRLSTANLALRKKNYSFAVRQAQECVELSLKSALRIYGVEHPKEHDVRELLFKVQDKFPKWFSAKLKKFGEISSKLAKDRGPSMYGDEEKGIPPSQIFDGERAKRAVQDAGLVHPACKKLLEDFLKKAT